MQLFWFVLIVVCSLIVKFDLLANFFTVIEFPLLITAAIFVIQVKRRSGEVYKKPNMKDVAMHAVIIGVVLVLYGIIYAAITPNYQGLIYYLIFLLGCLLWYRRIEGKVNSKNVAKYSAQGAVLFALLKKFMVTSDKVGM